jgi:5-carboxymethyl-2-hydroxymuconate isomerase
MPHLILEYSENVPEIAFGEGFFNDIHELLISTGPFNLADIKSRAYCSDRYCIGDGSAQNAFIHVTIKMILEGRDLSMRSSISKAIHTFILKRVGEALEELACSVTVEILEINGATIRIRLRPV